jgi:glycosyltransferase 2 family protein
MHWLKSKQFKLIISLLVSGILLVIIYRKVDLAVLKDTLLNLSPLPAAVFLLLILIQLVLSTLRWNLFTRQLGGVKLGFVPSLQQVVGSYSANLLIPGKWGEIVRIPWMKKYQLKVPVLFMVFLEKALDTLSVVSILFISSLVLVITGFSTPVPLMPFLLISGLVLLLVLFVVLFRKYLGSLVTKLGSLRKKPLKQDGFVQKGRLLLEMAGDKFWLYYGFSFVIWVLQVLQFYFIFLMLGITLSLVYTYAGSCLALLAGVIPVSIAGMGTRDAVIIGFFNHLAPYELLASVGILSLLRIILPALIGIPFFIIQTKES